MKDPLSSRPGTIDPISSDPNTIETDDLKIALATRNNPFFIRDGVEETIVPGA